MRLKQRIRLLKERGCLGPRCPQCHSPLGSTAYGLGWRRCRACEHAWNQRARPAPPDPLDDPLPAPLAPVQGPLTQREQRRRDLRDVYWRDRHPLNETTRKAMRRRRRS